MLARGANRVLELHADGPQCAARLRVGHGSGFEGGRGQAPALVVDPGERLATP
jgi:hypothetical protein